MATMTRADMNTDEAIGRRIHEGMTAAGMTQTQLAARMGITQAAISRKLSGERPWFADELVSASAILGISVGELFGERRKPRRQRPTGAAARVAVAPVAPSMAPLGRMAWP